MDQYFNDLASYEDTIDNYIKLFKELQKNKEPLIYLIHFPQLPKFPHPLTRSSNTHIQLSD